jgi:hypothetical protein
MKLNIFTTAIVLIPLCLATPLSAQTKEQLPSSNSNAQGTSTSSPHPTHKYPPQIVQALTNACIQGSNSQSLHMKQFSACSINKIQNQYSLEQFITMPLEIKDDKNFPKEFMELGFQCTVETLSSQYR